MFEMLFTIFYKCDHLYKTYMKNRLTKTYLTKG